MAWNRAPIYLPITGVTLLVRPPIPAHLWEAGIRSCGHSRVRKSCGKRCRFRARNGSAPHSGGNSPVCRPVSAVIKCLSIGARRFRLANHVVTAIRNSRSADLRRKPHQGEICGEHSAYHPGEGHNAELQTRQI